MSYRYACLPPSPGRDTATPASPGRGRTVTHAAPSHLARAAAKSVSVRTGTFVTRTSSGPSSCAAPAGPGASFSLSMSLLNSSSSSFWCKTGSLKGRLAASSGLKSMGASVRMTARS